MEPLNMGGSWTRRVLEATEALARADVESIENLERSCVGLYREFTQMEDPAQRRALIREICLAADQLATLGRVLTATRGNLEVFRRVLGRGVLPYFEYRWPGMQANAHCMTMEGHSGDD